MIKIKILYNRSEIDDLPLFDEYIEKIQKEYNNNFNIVHLDEKKFDLLVNDKIVYTLDDNFSIEPISTQVLLKKIDHHIYSVKSLKRKRQDSKFDDIGLVDF